MGNSISISGSKGIKKLKTNETGISIGNETPINDSSEIRKSIEISSATNGNINSQSMNSRKISTVFHWEHGGRHVYISGSFDQWKSKVPMIMSGNEFLAILELEEGVYEFKFLVDNQWKFNHNISTVDDGHMGRNNVIHVTNTDTNVFESLRLDASRCSNTASNQYDAYGNCANSQPNMGQTNQNDDFTQIIPPINLNDIDHQVSRINKINLPPNSPSSTPKSNFSPPTLPSHNMNSILNKFKSNTDSFGEPIELGVPEPVTLRHVYCMSTKDNIYSMSVSRRYREKFITTIYFKPSNL